MSLFYLPENANDIVLKHQKIGFKVLVLLQLFISIAIWIFKYQQTGDFLISTLRVGWIFPFLIVALAFWKKDGGTQRASAVMLYGTAFSWIVLRLISDADISAQFIHYPPFAIACVFLLGVGHGSVLAVATFILLLGSSWFAKVLEPFPILFYSEANVPYFSGPIATLIMFVLVWRLVVDLKKEGERSYSFLLGYLSNYQHLVSIITHDLSNLVLIADMGLQMGKQDRSASALKRAVGLIDSVRDMQKIGEGKQEDFQKGLSSPSEILETCRFVFAAHPSSKSLKLECDSSLSEDIKIKTSGPIFNHSIIHNFLSNAIKFSPDNGTIRIKLYSVGSKIIIEIIDEGKGMPAEVTEALNAKGLSVPSHKGERGEAGHGQGLRNALEMSARLGHTVEFLANEPSGTIVRVMYALETAQ